MLFTIIGTLSHEYGHIIIAKYFGHETELHYGSMSFEGSDKFLDYESIYKEYKHEINNDLSFPEKAEFDSLLEKLKTEYLLILIGGPAQTILTGLFGLFLLFLRRNFIRNNGLKLIDWLLIFLSLFWLRKVFNLVGSIASGLFNGTGIYFSGDEAKISKYLELPISTIPVILGILGLLISIFVIFRIIPIKLRLTFIIGGLIGGISGFIIWMNILGPIILPY